MLYLGLVLVWACLLFDCVCVVLCFGSLCSLVVALVVWYLVCGCKALMFGLWLW